jgi:hypothetical protein
MLVGALPYGLIPQQASLNFAPPTSASSSGGMDTMDDLQHSPLRSSSIVGQRDLRATPSASTSGGMDTVDELLGPAAAGLLLPHNDNGSSYGHPTGSHLQPPHLLTVGNGSSLPITSVGNTALPSLF